MSLAIVLGLGLVSLLVVAFAGFNAAYTIRSYRLTGASCVLYCIFLATFTMFAILAAWNRNTSLAELFFVGAGIGGVGMSLILFKKKPIEMRPPGPERLIREMLAGRKPGAERDGPGTQGDVSQSSSSLRELSRRETRLIERLLDRDFPGANELRSQIAHALFLPNNDGTLLRFKISPKASLAFSPRAKGLIADVETTDSDGVPIEVLLFAKDGHLDLLEYVKGDGSTIRRWPSADDSLEDRLFPL